MNLKKISAFFPPEKYYNGNFGIDGILDSIPVPLFIKDATGVFLNCNRAYENFIGLSRTDVIGKTVYDFAPEKLADVYHAKDVELLKKGSSQIYEGTVLTKGMIRNVLFHKSICRNLPEHDSGLVGVIIDITEQKIAEKLLQERVEFERIISTISAECIKTHIDTSTAILNALSLISKFINADNSYIFITSANGRNINKAYHWDRLVDQSARVNLDSMTNVQLIHRNLAVSIMEEFDTTQEDSTYYERNNDKFKRMIFPLKNGNEWIGTFHFEWDKSRCIETSKEHVTLLKVLAEIFMSMLQRQKAEDFLRASEEKNKAILEAIPDAMAVVTPDFKIVEFKKARNFGHMGDGKIFAGKTLQEILPEEVARLYRENITLAFQSRQVTCFEYQIRHIEETRAREARAVVISDEYILIMLRDITERKNAEEEIHKLSLVVEQSPGEITITDRDRRIIYANSKFIQNSGYSIKELKGTHINALMAGLQSDSFYREMQNTIESGNEWRGEICSKKKNGELRWSLVSLLPLKKLDGEVSSFLGVGQDITDKKLMEETIEKRNAEIQEALANLKQTQLQLVQQEKLAGIGQLAAGVAHEINNPLGFVLSNFDCLKQYAIKITAIVSQYRELKNKALHSNDQEIENMAEQLAIFEKKQKIDYILGDLEPIMQETDEGLKRLSDIVKALKLFSRVDRGSEFESYDLNTGIKNTLIIAKNEIKYIAEIELALGEMPEIQASAGQINQVLLNLILNAAYAIKEKQMEKLGTVKIASYHDNQFVYCTIQDNGLGMSEETSKKIFNAFFTTKPIGQGTGLGLSISYDIVMNKHHGDISVSSEEGVGTIFTIKLPLSMSSKNEDES